MKLKFYLSVFAVGIIAISSCKKADVLPINKRALANTLSSDTDIYAAGYETVPGTFNSTQPVYWKNGVLNKLPENTSGVANDIAVQNGDVLVAGTEVFDNQTGATQAFYWRNGVKTVLAQNATATRILVDSSGTNVYIVGSIGQVGSLAQTACYWKNGVVHLLPCNGPGTGNVEVANDIVIKGNDIYVAGVVQSISSGQQYAVFWKNDQVQFLPEEQTTGDAEGIFVNGADVYIAGYSGSLPTVWKNGVPGTLPGSTAQGFVAAAVRVTFVGNDEYVAGNNNVSGEGVYWKNKVMTSLSNSAYTARPALCMAVLGNSFYIGGSVTPTAGPAASIPAYWKNGVLTRLPYDSNGAVQGITAVLHH